MAQHFAYYRVHRLFTIRFLICITICQCITVALTRASIVSKASHKHNHHQPPLGRKETLALTNRQRWYQNGLQSLNSRDLHASSCRSHPDSEPTVAMSYHWHHPRRSPQLRPPLAGSAVEEHSFPVVDHATPTWRSVSTPSQKRRYPFVKTLGLRHKPTMNWGMRARARNQMQWDSYWYHFEAGPLRNIQHGHKDAHNQSGAEESIMDGVHKTTSDTVQEAHPAVLELEILSRTNGNTTRAMDDKPTKHPEESEGVADQHLNDGVSATENLPSFSEESTEQDSDPGYFYFSQILDHFDASSEAPSMPPNSTAPPPAINNTFRQYYHVSSEFYKPGGPIILWIPGESPLQSLFLQRGLAYELANATSGLLVALEHRFYGSSIPRFQNAHPVHKDAKPGDRIKQETTAAYGLGRGIGGGGAGGARRGVWGATSVVRSNPRTSTADPASSNSKGKGNGKIKGGAGDTVTDPRRETLDHSSDKGDDEKDEGLPLDLLKYLSVDQSIGDIVYFMDHFSTLQPSFVTAVKDERATRSSPPLSPPRPRWILAGCSYGGNLAAWTHQRYPSKVFAAFASSAPVRSALDFYEYSTSQTGILGKQCSRHLAKARDFFDGALQMTDEFIQHMRLFRQHEGSARGALRAEEAVETGSEINDMTPPADVGSSSSSEVINIDLAGTSLTPIQTVADMDKISRQAAKLEVLTWFSPDFANDYALEGDEVHAAGWVWWTVASAVQYNGVVTPANVEPAKTAVDILCDTMALVQENSSLPISPLTHDSDSSRVQSPDSVHYAKALATWFKDQQYFTPTKTEDLQPSDLDPNSVQNLASLAWLWQTCSELGYLQTSRPSTCCCSFSKALNTNTTLISTSPIPPPFQFQKENTSPSITSPKSPSDDSACLLCPCPANKMSPAPAESVFSRLLTLEAAWQECQFYFGTTQHSSQPNNITKDSSKNTNNQHPIPTANPSKTSQQKGADGEGENMLRQDDGGINRVGNGTAKNGTLTEPSTLEATDQLLHGYPDVERNVNEKFHGWEIVDESAETLCRREQRSITTDQIQTTTISTEPLTAPSEHDIKSKSEDSTDFSVFSSSHPGTGGDSGHGRYYFTNGENDPWKELTLASTQALEFLQRQSSIRGSKNSKKRGHTEVSSLDPFSFSTPSAATATSTTISSSSAFSSPSHHQPQLHHKEHRMRQRGRGRRGVDYGIPSVPHRPEIYPMASEEEDEDTDAIFNMPIDAGLDIGTTATPIASSHRAFKVQRKPTDGTENEIEEERWGNRNVVRIIPGASHCQDILYESSDLESVELREERQHVLKTFVRWIQMDERREFLQQQRQRRRQGERKQHQRHSNAHSTTYG